MNARLAEALVGCTKAVVGTDTDVIWPLATLLVQHGHHFAVVNSGKTLVMSDASLEFLKAQGVKI